MDEIHELKGGVSDKRLRGKGNKVSNANISGRTAVGGWDSGCGGSHLLG